MERLTIPDEKNRGWSEKDCNRCERSKKECYDNLLGSEKVRGHWPYPGADHGVEGAGCGESAD